MSQYSHQTVDLANENTAPTKIVHLVGMADHVDEIEAIYRELRAARQPAP